MPLQCRVCRASRRRPDERSGLGLEKGEKRGEKRVRVGLNDATRNQGNEEIARYVYQGFPFYRDPRHALATNTRRRAPHSGGNRQTEKFYPTITPRYAINSVAQPTCQCCYNIFLTAE